MRILVVGAGAVGGFFGGRLAQIGRDVTFLVRPGRADQLKKYGLHIVSALGNANLQPKVVLARDLESVYDLILLSVKAYALESAMDDFAAAIGPATMILPMLNGMRHIDSLAERFGAQAVLGGACMVATDLGDRGEIIQLTETQKVVFGELSGGISERIHALEQVLQGANFLAEPSDSIAREMWLKWVLLATLGSLTCLMRGSVGEIATISGGATASLAILAECCSIAAASGFAPDETWVRKVEKNFSAPGSTLTSSMYRDLLKGRPVEADQIVGDLLRHAETHHLVTPLLRSAYVQLAVHMARLRAPQAG